MIVSTVLLLVLSARASLHLFWGLGGLWPGRTGPELAAMVVGTRDRAPPGLAACAMVALALFGVGYIVGVGEGAPRLGLPDGVWAVGYWGACGVFLLRGLASYIPGPFDYAKETPFFALNRRIYGPLCLAIAGLMLLGKLG